VTILADGVFALSEGVPELDGLVAGGGDDLPVVSGEGDAEDIGGVADEPAGGQTGVEVPKAEGLVPGGGQTELAIRGHGEVLDEVVVAGKKRAETGKRQFSQFQFKKIKMEWKNTPEASSWGDHRSRHRG